MVFELSIFKNTQTITGVWTFDNDLFIKINKKVYFGTNAFFYNNAGAQLELWYTTEVYRVAGNAIFWNRDIYPVTPNNRTLGFTNVEFKSLYLGEGADKTFGLNMGLAQEISIYYNGTNCIINSTGRYVHFNDSTYVYMDLNEAFIIRDKDDVVATLLKLDTTARTLEIGLITKRIDIDHFGKNDTQTNIIIPLENFVEGSATCNQVNFNSDVGEQYWDLIKATTPVLRLNSGIRPPAGVNTMVIKYRARVDVSVSVDFNVNYSLSGAAKVSGSSVVLSTTKTEYESAEITISDTDYINIDITHNSGANNVELFRMEINFFKI